jgi:hypothetical protein
MPPWALGIAGIILSIGVAVGLGIRIATDKRDVAARMQGYEDRMQGYELRVEEMQAAADSAVSQLREESEAVVSNAVERGKADIRGELWPRLANLEKRNGR